MNGGADKRIAQPEQAANDDFDMEAGDGLAPQNPPKLIVDPLGELGIEERRARYNVSNTPVSFQDEDPLSLLYARETIDETAGTILAFWFAMASERPDAIPQRVKFWFNGGFDIDRMIANRFGDIVAKLSAGEAWRWANVSPRDRLAAVIALDQFTRNIFRGTAGAFENDALARELTLDALALDEDRKLAPVERWFLYMPLVHSESATDQRRAVDKFTELLPDAPPEAKAAFASALDFAKRHAVVIRKFGRFPHRNAMLGRTSSSAELAFLKKPGSRF